MFGNYKISPGLYQVSGVSFLLCLLLFWKWWITSLLTLPFLSQCFTVISRGQAEVTGGEGLAVSALFLQRTVWCSTVGSKKTQKTQHQFPGVIFLLTELHLKGWDNVGLRPVQFSFHQEFPLISASDSVETGIVSHFDTLRLKNSWNRLNCSANVPPSHFIGANWPRNLMLLFTLSFPSASIPHF